jgi:hypothetical protein
MKLEKEAKRTEIERHGNMAGGCRSVAAKISTTVTPEPVQSNPHHAAHVTRRSTSALYATGRPHITFYNFKMTV